MSLLQEAWVRSEAAQRVQGARVATARGLARVMAGGLALFALLLTFLPWQQAAPGKGKVLTYSPLSRPQLVEAPVEGRVVRWWVEEGTVVQAGQPLLEIRDLDAGLLGRLQSEVVALEARASALGQRAQGLDARAEALRRGREAAMRSAQARAEAARARLVQAQRAEAAAVPAARVALLNLQRQRALQVDGLAATRALELAQAEEARARTDLERAQAAILGAQAELASAEADRSRVALDAQAGIEDAMAGAQSARADQANVQAELARTRVRLSRQGAQVVKAPRAGMVTRVQGGREGEMVRSGDPLLSLVPDSHERAVELFLEGLDAPLVQVGQAVRVQLEGWPAVALPGWPVAMVGTFGGKVSMAETALQEGKLRILVQEDGQDPWPPPEVLRQGLQARGWVLLGVVPLGYEFWRLANGFPPQAPKPNAEAAPKVDPALKRWSK